MKQLKPIRSENFVYTLMQVCVNVGDGVRIYNILHEYMQTDKTFSFVYILGDASCQILTQENLEDIVHQLNDDAYGKHRLVVNGQYFQQVNPEESTPRDIAIHEAVLEHFVKLKLPKPVVRVGFDCSQ